MLFCAAGSARAGDDAAAKAAAEASAIVEAHRGTPEFWAPPAFDSSPAQGKTVWWISDYKTNILKQWAVQAETAAGEAGLKFHLYDGGGSVPEQVRGFELAIAAKADAIVLDFVRGGKATVVGAATRASERFRRSA